ncbi:hypothetical protein 65p404 [Aeromonas phage 65]|uniref:Phage protein n=2 Tax=Ishigurovirus osborne TaxID=260149 RepID=A0A219YCP4_9CAUD|nr:hypothetical protein ST65p404 [Aeromonas phage 65]ADQ53411.1 hypothetical protein 65p404 [Aeromonas phage 65]APU01768.1 hypothetical protein [Aeromonas phage 65.2]
MDVLEFEQKVMELVNRFDETVPNPFRVGHIKKSDTIYEIAVVDPVGMPVLIHTVYIDKFGEVCYCVGQQYKNGKEKAIN